MGQTQPAELTTVVRDVGLGGGPGMLPLLHRVLLGRQAERVEAQRVQHIRPGHPAVAAVHVGADVTERVTDVQPVRRRVGEHVQQIELRSIAEAGTAGQGSDRVRGLEGAIGLPAILPSALQLGCEHRGVAVRRGATSVRDTTG